MRWTGQGRPIALATVALFLVSPMVVSGSLGHTAMATVLPFAAILAVAAAGQTLVVQQGGMDFSVAGTISVSAVVFARTAQEEAGRIPLALAATLAVAAGIGATSAVAVVLMRIPSLVATLGVNALVLGLVQHTSGGISVTPGPAELTRFALSETLGVPHLVVLAVVMLLAIEAGVSLTTTGRRFVAAGSSPTASRALGLPVRRYQAAAYMGATCLYASAGVLLVGLLVTPGLRIGDPYLLSTIAAVVLGGTALSGGRGSVLASAVAALFLTQLSQLLYAAGTETSLNYVVQGAVIGASMLIRSWYAVARKTLSHGIHTSPDPVEPAVATRVGSDPKGRVDVRDRT